MDGILRVYDSTADRGDIAIEIGFTLKKGTNRRKFAEAAEQLIEKYSEKHNTPDIQIY